MEWAPQPKPLVVRVDEVGRAESTFDLVRVRGGEEESSAIVDE